MAKEQTAQHPRSGHVALLGYDSVNDRYQVLHVDATGKLQIDVAASEALDAHLHGWDGDSWEKLTVDASGRLNVTIPLEEALGARSYQYDGTTWRRSNLLWGYNDVWDQNLGGTATGDPYYSASSAVPSGQVWVLQALTICNLTRATTSVYLIIVRASGAWLYLNYAATLAQNTPLTVTGNFTLGVGDYVSVVMYSSQAGDTVRSGLCGYKMKLTM